MAKRRAKTDNVALFPGVEQAPDPDHVDAVKDAFEQGLTIFVVIGRDDQGEVYINVPMDMTLEQAEALWRDSLSQLQETVGPKGGGKGGKGKIV
jgi:hypothetical protein